MASDLARYLFSASFAHLLGYFPRLDVFPPKLLPDHINVHVEAGIQKPSRSRIGSACSAGTNRPPRWWHILPGRALLHPLRPSQCRSLTVREAAGSRRFPTTMSSRAAARSIAPVGNAVPPLLAHKLARIVRSLLNEMSRRKRRQTGVDAIQKRPAGSVRRNLPEQLQVLCRCGLVNDLTNHQDILIAISRSQPLAQSPRPSVSRRTPRRPPRASREHGASPHGACRERYFPGISAAKSSLVLG